MSADERSEKRQQLHQTRRRPCKHGVLRGGRARGRPSRLKVQPPVARVLLPPVLTPQAGASQGSEAPHQTHTAAGLGWTSPVVRVPDRWSPRSNTTTATPLCYCFLPASWCWCRPTRRAPGVEPLLPVRNVAPGLYALQRSTLLSPMVQHSATAGRTRALLPFPDTCSTHPFWLSAFHAESVVAATVDDVHVRPVREGVWDSYPN